MRRYKQTDKHRQTLAEINTNKQCTKFSLQLRAAKNGQTTNIAHGAADQNAENSSRGATIEGTSRWH